MSKLTSTLITLFLFASLSSAGPNSKAVLYVNFKQDTASIDSTKFCKLSDTVVAAVQITNAVNLFDYEVHVSFDTARLQFLNGKKDYGTQKNILETKDGSTFFKCSYSQKDSTRIIVASSILGDEEKQCPAGSGFLGFLYFKKKTADTTTIKIYSSLLETYSTLVDTMVKSVNGVIYPGSAAVIKRNAAKPYFSVQKADDMVTIYSPENIQQSIQLFTIDGRCLTKIASNSRKTCIPLPNLIGKGACVIRVQNKDNIYSSLLLNN